MDDNTRHGFIIDPGAQADILIKIISENSFVIDKIILTHCHFDHFGAANELRAKLNCPILAHEKADLFLLDPIMNLSRQCVGDLVIKDTVKFTDGDIISLNSSTNCSLQVIFAPGHTPDSVLLYNEKDNIAFVGDTIFKGSIGNYTFPGGNKKILIQSIMEKVFALPNNTIIYSGHSEPTTVGAEKRYYRLR
ncbi:MAG: MBL fold metallo-hydrolase [Firmicutes bacterium]|nr:MBL fold metallo-hydrolase [Bacillota bacterium]